MNAPQDVVPASVNRATVVRPLVLLGVFAAALLLYGCDALVEGDDTLILQPKTVTFRFEFSSDDLTPGEAITVSAVQSADLGAALQGDGYTKDDVVSAQITEIQLRRVNPLQFNLGGIDNVVLRLQSQGVSSVSVGSIGDPPSSNSANMQVGPTRNVAQFVRQSSFTATLEFVPTGLPADDYVLETRVELSIEVEGV